jgi:hypothetical protein
MLFPAAPVPACNRNKNEQGNNDNEVARRGYLEFRPSRSENKAKNRGSQYEGHPGDK